MIERLFRKKPVDVSLNQNILAKTMSLPDLFAYGISATVGSGIYLTIGDVALNKSGPSIAISVTLAGLCALTSGFCFLDLAGRIPSAGSAFIYAYTFFGELPAWIVGWNLTFEYAFCAAAVAATVSAFIKDLLEQCGVVPPAFLFMNVTAYEFLRPNLMAVIFVVIIAALLTMGVRSSITFSNIITCVNLLTLSTVIVAGGSKVKTSNWTPFAPNGASKSIDGAFQLFYSYLGFDTLCSMSGEAKNPKRDIPLSMFGTVLVATILYISVGLVLTGVQPYYNIATENALQNAFRSVGLPWMSYIVGVCAISSMTATLLACMLGQPRIFFSLAQDGFLPASWFAESVEDGISKKSLLISSAIIAFLAGILNVDIVLDMVSYGTLMNFSLVSAGVIVSRLEDKGVEDLTNKGRKAILGYCFLTYFAWVGLSYNIIVGMVMIAVCVLVFFYIIYVMQKANALGSSSVFRGGPSNKRVGFVCPLVPFIPCASIALTSRFMSAIGSGSILFFGIVFAIGVIIYFGYGYHHSLLHKSKAIDTKAQEKQFTQ